MKFISIIVILLSFFFVSDTSALDTQEKSDFLKNRIESEINKGVAYTETIEIFILGIQNDEKKLNTLLNKIVNLEKKLQIIEGRTTREEQVLMLVTYIKYQIFLQLTPIIGEEEGNKEKIEDIQDVEDNYLEITKPEIDFLDISEQEFDETFFSKDASELEELLKDIYKNHKGIPTGQVVSILQEDMSEVVTWYNLSLEKERDTQRKNDMKEIQTLIETYKDDNDVYPSYSIVQETIAPNSPKDPLGGLKKYNCRFGYIYEVWGNGKDYRLSTCLESRTDKLISNDGGIDNGRYEVGTDISYSGKGISYTNNSDLFYFSQVDAQSTGGTIHGHSIWSTLPDLSGYDTISKYDQALTLLRIEYEQQNPWIDKNLISYNTMNIIASSLDSYFLNGDILEVIKHDERFEGENISVGAPLKAGENYKVGTIDYTKLGLKSFLPKDTTGQKFLLAYASTGWGHYQVLGRAIEKTNDSYQQKILIRGTYYPKNQILQKGADYRTVGDDEIQLLDANLIYLFKGGDIINNTHEIAYIDYNTNTLHLGSSFDTLEGITLDEPAGLIFNPETNTPYTQGTLIPLK